MAEDSLPYHLQLLVVYFVYLFSFLFIKNSLYYVRYIHFLLAIWTGSVIADTPRSASARLRMNIFVGFLDNLL